MASGGVTVMGTGTGFAPLLPKAPVPRETVAAACAPYTRPAMALPTPGVAPWALLPRVGWQRAQWVTPATWERQRGVGGGGCYDLLLHVVHNKSCKYIV